MQREQAAETKSPTDTADDGFVMESASVPFTAAPDDTTQRAQTPPPAAPAPAADTKTETETDTDTDTETESEEQTPPPATDVESASAATSATKPAQKKKGPSLAERNAELRKKIDQSTYEWRETQRRIDAAKRELAEIEQRRTAAGAPPADGVTKPESKVDKPGQPAATAGDALPPMPEHPKYRDFNTDEEYEAAIAKWRTDLATWQTQQAQALKSEITKGLESRLESERTAAQAAEAQNAFVQRLQKAREAKPDWNEKAETLKDLRSSWYDPTKHGQTPTPFLSDVAASHEDGPELLYWLGSDPVRAQVLADLLPTRPLRDAIVHAPSAIQLFDHFATPEGAKTFDELKRMPPVRMHQAIGALSARLAAASSGSAAAAHHPITSAVPPAKPPGGSPGARGSAPAQSNPKTFDSWMAEEDERERKDRLQRAGVSA